MNPKVKENKKNNSSNSLVFGRWPQTGRLGRIFTDIGGSNNDNHVTLDNTFSVIKVFSLFFTQLMGFVTSSLRPEPLVSVNI